MKRLAVVFATSIMVLPVAAIPVTPDAYPRWICRILPIVCP
ncbi:MAG: hypothetical protein ACK5LS_06865 [Propioniciclava sp.]